MEKNLYQIIDTFYFIPESSRKDLESSTVIIDLDSYDWLFIRVKIRDLSLPNKEHNFFLKFAYDQQLKKREDALIKYEELLNNKILKLEEFKNKIEFCTLELSSISKEEERISIKIKQEQMGIHFQYEFEDQMLYTHKKTIINNRIFSLTSYSDILNQEFDDNLWLTLQYYSINKWFDLLYKKIHSWSKDRKLYYLIDIKSKIKTMIGPTSEKNLGINYYEFNNLGDKQKIGTNYLTSFLTRLKLIIKDLDKAPMTYKLTTDLEYNRLSTIFSALFLNNEELQPVLQINNLKGFLLNAFEFSSTSNIDYIAAEYSANLLPNKGGELITRIGLLMSKEYLKNAPHEYLEKWFNHNIKNKKGLSIANINLNISKRKVDKEFNKHKNYYKAVFKMN